MRVFLTSLWIPAEWIRAHGLDPQCIWSVNDFRCDSPLSAGLCAFAEGVVRFAETHPESIAVFASSCDQLRRGFDALVSRRGCRAFLFNLPATQTSAARQIYRHELERLGKFLVQCGGIAPTAEILGRELLRANEGRRRELTKAPFLSGNYVPLALVGGPVCAGHRRVYDAIETAGANVVLDATESGERCFCPHIKLDDADDPFEALVTGYFENVTDVFQRPNDRLYEWLKVGLASRRVRGIVLWLFTGCDLWRAEAESLRETFRLPVLLLEVDESAGVSPRDLNRIQAFVEMLK